MNGDDDDDDDDERERGWHLYSELATSCLLVIITNHFNGVEICCKKDTKCVCQCVWFDCLKIQILTARKQKSRL